MGTADRDTSFADVAVVGGGIAGLTVARLLHRRGYSVRILEQSDRLGGAIQTYSRDGFLAECGPNTVVSSHPEVAELVKVAGLEDQQIFANGAASKRFVVRGGVLLPVPTSLGAFISTRLFSAGAKARLLWEPFVSRARPHSRESVAEFVRRRLGSEFLNYAVDPFVAGVYAGDPEKLDLKTAFPRLARLEARHGSLIRGQLKGAGKKTGHSHAGPSASRMFTFKDGLETLPKALAGAMPSAVRLGATVHRAVRGPGGWRISVRGAPDVQAECLVVASGLRSATWLESLGARIRVLEQVQYPPLTVISLGFPRHAVAHALDGFGLLAPRLEGRNILGALFPSSLFEGRAPEGHVLLTVFVGGSRAPEAALLPDDALKEAVMSDLESLLGVTSPPGFEHVVRWPASIPQFTAAFPDVHRELDRLEAANDSLFFAGNYRSGISVPDTIRHAFETAGRVHERLSSVVVSP